MKQSGQCLKCKCRRLLLIEKVLQSHPGSYPTTFEVCVRTQPLQVNVGSFEVLICTQCGYTEWYAHDFEELRQHLPKLYPGVRLLDTEPPAGPYR